MPRWIGLAIGIGLGSHVHGQALQNPGFEDPYVPVSATGITGDVASGWNDNTDWVSGVNLVYSKDTGVRRSGLASQKVQVQAKFAQFVQWMPFSPGRIQASIWMRSQNPMWVSLILRGSGFKIYGASTVRLSATWQKVEVGAVCPVDPEGGLFINTAGTGTLWLDDATYSVSPTLAGAPLKIIPPPSRIPASFFGIHPSHTDSPPFLPWPSVPFGTVRSHDCAPKWAQIEPMPPIFGTRQYDWTELDQFVSKATARGQRVIYTIYQTPPWATSNIELDPYGSAGGASMPTSVTDYADFVAALAARYRGRIHAYEVWNEPDIGFWTGTPAQMATLANACVAAVQMEDPAATVIGPPHSGGTAMHGAFDWYERFLLAGGGQGLEAISSHFYSEYPEEDIPKAAAFRQLLGLWGLRQLPLIHSETGIGYAGDRTDDEVTAHYARTMVVNWALGFDSTSWYQWNEVSKLGVRQNSQGQWTVLTPAAQASGRVLDWLVGSTMTSFASTSQGLFVAKFSRGPRSRFWVVWSPDQELFWQPPQGAIRARFLDQADRSLRTRPTLSIGPTPVRIDIDPLLDARDEGPTDSEAR